MRNPFIAPDLVKPAKSSFIIGLLQFLAVAVLVGIFGYTFIITPNQVNGNSMVPTLLDDQIVMTNRLYSYFFGTDFGNLLGLYYNRGDIVVVRTPLVSDDLVKRIIALPGEEILISGGTVSINGKIVSESYLADGITTTAGDLIKEGEVFSVPRTSYVIMGDNRPGSEDSRLLQIGLIKPDQIIGKVVFRIWPISAAGMISHGGIN